MRLGELDESGRRRPVPVDGSQFILNVDTAIIAIGQSPNPLLARATPELKTGRDGIIEVDEKTQATNLPGVYAGGDITNGADTVISAMGAGKRAAKAIDEYIRNTVTAQLSPVEQAAHTRYVSGSNPLAVTTIGCKMQKQQYHG